MEEVSARYETRASNPYSVVAEEEKGEARAHGREAKLH